MLFFSKDINLLYIFLFLEYNVYILNELLKRFFEMSNLNVTVITFEEKSNDYVFFNGLLFSKNNDLDLFELSQMVKGKAFTLTTLLVKNSPKLMDDLFYAKENEYHLNSVKLTKHNDSLIGDFFTEVNH